MVNYDILNEPETYVHRIGRTGRAGKNGIAYSFCMQEEVEYLLDVQKMLGKKIPVVIDHSFAIEVDESIKAPKKQQRGGKRSSNFGSKRISNDNGKRNIRRKKNKRS